MYETRNPVEDRFRFRTQGMFRCSRSTERIGLLVSFIVTLFVYSGGYGVMFGIYKETTLWAETDPFTFGGVASLTFFAFTVIVIVGETIAVRIILSGRVYRYSANDVIFSFMSEQDKVRRVDIRYDDVLSVSYMPRKLFGIIDRGYTVSVVTGSLGIITFDYIHGKGIGSRTPANTPFRIIEERMLIQREKLSAQRG